MSTSVEDDLVSKVRAILAGIQSGDRTAVAAINPGPYKQHNLDMTDGRQGFEAALNTMPPNTMLVNVIRAFRDGEYVVTHEEYDYAGGSQIGFDVFRFEDGLATEHWDNLQNRQRENGGLTPSGHTQIDGPTEVKDRDCTAANKALVKKFVEETHIDKKLDNLESYFHEGAFIQHDPRLADGVVALREALEAQARSTDKAGKVLTRIHKVLGEGNFVLVMAEGTFNGTPSGLYDLFLVEGGKIREHWDVIQTIPPEAEWKNPNGKF